MLFTLRYFTAYMLSNVRLYYQSNQIIQGYVYGIWKYEINIRTAYYPVWMITCRDIKRTFQNWCHCEMSRVYIGKWNITVRPLCNDHLYNNIYYLCIRIRSIWHFPYKFYKIGAHIFLIEQVKIVPMEKIVQWYLAKIYHFLIIRH